MIMLIIGIIILTLFALWSISYPLRWPLVIVGCSLVTGIACFVFWLCWWPIRLFFFSLIPASAAYGWVGKIIIVCIIAMFGGVWIPFVVWILGLMLIFSLLNER